MRPLICGYLLGQSYRATFQKRGGTFSLPMNLPFVAANVRRRTLLEINDIRLVTSAATVQGFNARTLVRGILTPALSRRARLISDCIDTAKARNPKWT